MVSSQQLWRISVRMMRGVPPEAVNKGALWWDVFLRWMVINLQQWQ